MSESPCADDNEMEEKSADSKSEEVFDKGARVFVEAFDHSIVLYACDNGKRERDEWHDGLEHALEEPYSAEGG